MTPREQARRVLDLPAQDCAGLNIGSSAPHGSDVLATVERDVGNIGLVGCLGIKKGTCGFCAVFGRAWRGLV